MNCWTAGRMNHVKRLWCLQFGFQSAVLWSSLAFKQRSNRTKQNHELTNQHNQRTVPLFNRGLTLSSQNSQWLDFWQLLDWWFSSVSTGARAGAQGQTPNARKPPSIQSGHCKLCVGCFSHIFCKHDQGGDSGANRGAGDNQQTTGSDFG